MKSAHQTLQLCAACCISSAILITACSEIKKEKIESADTLAVRQSALNLTYTGYIRSALYREGKDIIVIDSIQYFSGDAAEKAFREDNKSTGKSGGLESGFYIRNSGIDSLEAVITDNSGVTMQTYSHDSTGSFRLNEKISAGSFLEFIRNKQAAGSRNIPFNFVIQGGIIISVKEIYIP